MSTTRLTARELVQRIRDDAARRGYVWADKTVDTFKAGDPDVVLSAVATSWMSTTEAIRAAAGQGCNLLVTHEPTFWNHLDVHPNGHQDDPVYRSKIRLIAESGMTIWRFHDHHHRAFESDPIFDAFLRSVGWKESTRHSGLRAETEIEGTLRDVADAIARALGTRAVRIIGNPDAPIHRIGYGGHMLGPSVLRPYESCDAVLVGEIRDWDAFEFFRDSQAAGEGKALIILSHRDLETAGSDALASWIGGLVPEVPVVAVPSAATFEVLDASP